MFEKDTGRKMLLQKNIGSFRLTAYGVAFCDICMDYVLEEDEYIT